METIRIQFTKPFLLKDYKDAQEGGGIYFHYIKIKNKMNKIIYVGQCQSFKLRQEEHFFNYDRNKYLLFNIENDELNLEFIPDYDLLMNTFEDFNTVKENTISSIYVICGQIENLSECNLKGIEGAIIIYLYRKSETRKFLLNTTINYTLRNTTLLFEGMEEKLLGIPDKVETPFSN